MNTLKRFRLQTLAALTAITIAAGIALGMGGRAEAAKKIPLKIARIYIEYNFTANDLGFHVSLDGEDWKTLKIIHPNGSKVFEVTGSGGFGFLGMTELFFEGAEPSLDDVDLEVLLALFPEGQYKFEGKYVDGADLTGTATLSHKVPDAPIIVWPLPDIKVDAENLVIDWDTVVPPKGGKITGYQVIVESFQITLPATKTQVTVPPEFLEPGRLYLFEVLAIEASGNQTIRESSFETE